VIYLQLFKFTPKLAVYLTFVLAKFLYVG
jgi:hypothetical protein